MERADGVECPRHACAVGILNSQDAGFDCPVRSARNQPLHLHGGEKLPARQEEGNQQGCAIAPVKVGLPGKYSAENIIGASGCCSNHRLVFGCSGLCKLTPGCYLICGKLSVLASFGSLWFENIWDLQ